MAKKINIPKSFNLGPYEITVNKSSDLIYREGAMGKAFLNCFEIGLQKTAEGYPLKPEQALVTFWHEFYHWLFFLCKQQALCVNEELVDQMAEFTTQMQMTSKGIELGLNFK